MSEVILEKDLRDRLADVIEAVTRRGDSYTIQREGRAVAEIIPASEAGALRKGLNDRLFSLVESLHERNRNDPEDDVVHAVDRAVEEVRRRRRERPRE